MVHDHSPVFVSTTHHVSDVPSAPRNVTVQDITKEGYKVAWSPPEDDGGTDIQHYTVEKKDMETERWVPVDETINTYLYADKLIEKQEYIFRVKAVNREGSSRWAATKESIVAKNPFGKKTDQTPDDCRFVDSKTAPCVEVLQSEFNKLRIEDSDSDIELRCGELSIKAHKQIFCAQSETFRTLVNDMVQEQGSIIINDLQPNILKTLISYIYTGELPQMTLVTVCDVHKAAIKYKMNILKKRCSELIVENFSAENVLDFLAMSNVHDDSYLKNKAFHYVIDKKIFYILQLWTPFLKKNPIIAGQLYMYMIFELGLELSL